MHASCHCPPCTQPSCIHTAMPLRFTVLYPESPFPCKLLDILQSPAPLKEVPHIQYVIVFGVSPRGPGLCFLHRHPSNHHPSARLVQLSHGICECGNDSVKVTSSIWVLSALPHPQVPEALWFPSAEDALWSCPSLRHPAGWGAAPLGARVAQQP